VFRPKPGATLADRDFLDVEYVLDGHTIVDTYEVR
jgi:hypothetical protein